MFKVSVELCALLLACASLLLAVSPAYSQMRPAPGKFFEGADANQDGTVTRDEFLAARAKTFERLDRNHDGFIDDGDAPKRRLAEGRAGGRIAGLRDQFDADGDGRVSQSEFANGPAQAFDRADGDGNGVLDADELAAVKAQAKR